MPTLVKIAGVTVDAENPCALYQALYAAKLKLIAGDAVEEVEVQSPATRRRLRVSKGNLAALDAELSRLATACSQQTGGARTRFAKRIRFV